MKLSEKEKIFLVKFFVIFAAAEILIHVLPLNFFMNAIASNQAALFGLSTYENLIFVKDGAFQIVPSCTGLVSGGVLASIIFSLKKPKIKEKMMIFLAGFVLLLVLNYFRIALVIGAGKEFGIEFAGILHVITWFTSAAFIIGIWYLFTKKITGEKNFSGFI